MESLTLGFSIWSGKNPSRIEPQIKTNAKFDQAQEFTGVSNKCGCNFLEKITWNWTHHLHHLNYLEVSKVHIFWEGHKSLQNLHLTFDWHSIGQKYLRWRFRKILWPSQNIWTLRSNLDSESDADIELILPRCNTCFSVILFAILTNFFTLLFFAIRTLWSDLAECTTLFQWVIVDLYFWKET